MKLLGSITVILILIVSGGFWINQELQISSNELVNHVDKVSEAIQTSNWDTAVEQTQDLEKTWEHEAKWWPVFLEHQEMDNIEFSMAKLKEYVASNNSALSLGQLSEIRLMIEHIPKKEKVSLENIL